MTYNPYRPPNNAYGPKGGQAPDPKAIESILANKLGPQVPRGLEIPLGPPPPKANPESPSQSPSTPEGNLEACLLLNSSPTAMGFQKATQPQAASQPTPPPEYDMGLYRDAYSRLGLMRLANICDLGCGAGNFTGVMVQKNQRPEVYLGVDNSHAQISVARAAYPGWSFIYGDFMSPAIRERYERYDAFLLLNVLDCLEDDLALLEILPSGKPVLFSMPRSSRAESLRFCPDNFSLKERYGSYLSVSSIGVYRSKGLVYSMAVGVRW